MLPFTVRVKLTIREKGGGVMVGWENRWILDMILARFPEFLPNTCDWVLAFERFHFNPNGWSY